MMLLIGLAITVAFVASLGREPRPARPRARLLVGARAADRDHAARPLDRDALARADHLRPGLARGAAARRGRAGRGRPRRDGRARRPARRRRRRRAAGRAACPPTAASSTGAREHGRVDGHRRVPPGRAAAPATPSPPARSRPTPGCGSRSPRPATTPRWPASSGWSPRRRTRPRAHSASPTAPRAGCSGSPSAPPRSPPWSGPLLGMPDDAVIRTITVLVIACPHALGLAIPLVVSIATERAARGGVLIKDRLALESMRTVDTVLFDKTGTLTKGEPTVARRRRPAGRPRRRRRCWRSRRPPSPTASTRSPRRSSRAAQERGLGAPARHRLRRRRPPSGVTRDGRRPRGPGRRPAPARAGGRRGRAAVADALAQRGRDHPARPARRRGRRRAAARRRDPPRIRATPSPRCTTWASQVVMITGDAEAVARSVADELGIDRVLRRRAARGQVRARCSSSRARAGRSRWSATASTTPPRWRRPTSASRSAPAPTSRSRPRASSSPATTPGRCCR